MPRGAEQLVRQAGRDELVLGYVLLETHVVAHAVLAVGILVILPLTVGAATSLFAGPAGESLELRSPTTKSGSSW